MLTGLVGQMRNEEPDFPKIAKLIGTDVALAATMLKTVNSPFYGLPPQSFIMVSLGIVAEKLYREHCGDTPGAEWTRAGAAAMQATGITEEDLAEFTGEIDAVLAAG